MSDDPGAQALILAGGSRLEMVPTTDGAKVALRAADGQPQLEIEVVLTAAGPLIRARATALDIDVARDLVARCETFRVEATETIDLVSRHDLSVTATTGSVRVQANDDVQLLGEQVLLNTDRQAELPFWLNAAPPAMETVSPSAVSGDPDLLETIARKG
jgi:hypothetical protein